MPARALRVGVVALLVAALTSCGPGEDKAADDTGTRGGEPGQDGTGGGQHKSVLGRARFDGDVWVELIAVDRAESNSVLVRFRLTNRSRQAYFPNYRLAAYPTENPDGTTQTVNGVSLVDLHAGKRYFPLNGDDGKCLCSDTSQVTLEPNGSAEMFAVLPAPPPAVKRITVAVPLAPPFTEIPIGAGPARLPAGVSAGAAAPPIIRTLISTVEGADGATDEDGGNERVRLSSDVLFALNKSAITSRARTVLADVARRIDRSTGSTVEIEGHTDNSGDDTINDPLSRRRAQAVQDRLRDLVTRQGVRYRATGHGSREPIAGNETAEGRRRNRRVTISFTRPAADRPSSPPTIGGPSSAEGGGTVATATPGPPRPGLDGARDVRLEVTGLTRAADGLVTLAWRLTNTGTTEIDHIGFFTPGPEIGYFQYTGGTSGVTVRDESRGLRYFNLRDSLKSCLCPDYIGFGAVTLTPAARWYNFNTFKLPPETRSVTIEFPGYRPLRNVAIG